jgi:hypothetical protein
VSVRGVSSIAALGIAALTGCRAHATGGITNPAPLRTARFVVAGDQRGVVPRGISAPQGNVSRCRLAARFEGKVAQGQDRLELTMPVVWLSVARNNDKQDECRVSAFGVR